MRCAALILVVGLLAAPRGWAEGADAEALRRIDSGIDAFRAGAYGSARREFEAARQLAPSRANPYRWLGLTEVKLGDCTQALLDFEMFLKLVPANDERVPEILGLRRQCEQPGLVAPAPPQLAPAHPTPTQPAPPAVSASTPPPHAPPRSIARRWWLWTSIGVATAAVALGVGLGVGLAPTHEPRFSPVVCDASGCRTAGAP